ITSILEDPGASRATTNPVVKLRGGSAADVHNQIGVRSISQTFFRPQIWHVGVCGKRTHGRIPRGPQGGNRRALDYFQRSILAISRSSRIGEENYCAPSVKPMPSFSLLARLQSLHRFALGRWNRSLSLTRGSRRSFSNACQVTISPTLLRKL